MRWGCKQARRSGRNGHGTASYALISRRPSRRLAASAAAIPNWDSVPSWTHRNSHDKPNAKLTNTLRAATASNHDFIDTPPRQLIRPPAASTIIINTTPAPSLCIPPPTPTRAFDPDRLATASLTAVQADNLPMPPSSTGPLSSRHTAPAFTPSPLNHLDDSRSPRPRPQSLCGRGRGDHHLSTGWGSCRGTGTWRGRHAKEDAIVVAVRIALATGNDDGATPPFDTPLDVFLTW